MNDFLQGLETFLKNKNNVILTTIILVVILLFIITCISSMYSLKEGMTGRKLDMVNICYISYMGKPTYSIPKNEVNGVLNKIKSFYPSSRVAITRDIQFLVDTNVAVCACGWHRKSASSNELTTGYPSTKCTSQGCGGGNVRVISCGDNGPNWANNRAGMWVLIVGDSSEIINTLQKNGLRCNVVESIVLSEYPFNIDDDDGFDNEDDFDNEDYIQDMNNAIVDNMSELNPQNFVMFGSSISRPGGGGNGVRPVQRYEIDNGVPTFIIQDGRYTKIVKLAGSTIDFQIRSQCGPELVTIELIYPNQRIAIFRNMNPSKQYTDVSIPILPVASGSNNKLLGIRFTTSRTGGGPCRIQIKKSVKIDGVEYYKPENLSGSLYNRFKSHNDKGRMGAIENGGFFWNREYIVLFKGFTNNKPVVQHGSYYTGSINDYDKRKGRTQRMRRGGYNVRWRWQSGKRPSWARIRRRGSGGRSSGSGGLDELYSDAMQNYYLPGWTPDGVNRYLSLEDAKQACNRIGDNCGGVTVNRGGVYSTRRGNTPLKSPSGELSWIKLSGDSGTYLDSKPSGGGDGDIQPVRC